MFSDGISSFTDKSGKKVPEQDVVDLLTDFRFIDENFIQRRAQHCFNRVFPKLGWSNYDDVSIIGAIDE